MSSHNPTFSKPSSRSSAHSAVPTIHNFAAIATEKSRQTQNTVLLIFIPLSLFFLLACLASIAWLAIHGQVLVPGQDTRLTSIVISTSSKTASLIMAFAFARSAWSSCLPDIAAGRALTTRSLVTICRQFMSLGQFQNIAALPTSFKIHILLAAFALTAMIATSSSFRYDSLPVTWIATARVADVAFACPAEKVVETGVFICDEGGSNNNILTNTSVHSWDYIGQVDGGGQNTVSKVGLVGDPVVGANVTLAVLPKDWKLEEGNNLPWMAMSVTCESKEISVSFTGTGISTNTTIYLDGKEADTLDIGNMPQWGSIIHLFPRVNSTGPFSSLGYYDVVMLARDEYDGSNMRGVSQASITELGSTWLDLRGYGPVEQGILGAGASCTFSASTGGQWQEGLWPPLNHTNNTFWGEMVDDQPTLAAAMLNYGASWQYTSVSENYLPGGSVSYIANNTGPDIPFSNLFAAYIRNQWTLMAYAIPRHTSQQLEMEFIGTGPNKLFISVTLVGVIPSLALLLSCIATVKAFVATVRYKYWVNRVEFESWWLVKSLRPDLYAAGYCNATEDAFENGSKECNVCYGDVRPMGGVGHLVMYRTKGDEGAAHPFELGRDYGGEFK